MTAEELVCVTADMCPHGCGSSMLCEICELKQLVECKDNIVIEQKSHIEKLREALGRIANGTHDEHPTCISFPKSMGDKIVYEYGPLLTGGWEGWARDIDKTHKQIATEALGR